MILGGEKSAWSLQDGISPDSWPEAARDATRTMRQGDLVESPPFFYAADPDHPIHRISVAWARTDKIGTGLVNVLNRDRRPPWGMIVTQTCDVVEEGKPKRPWAQVAPVYRLDCDRGVQKMIERDRGFEYLCPVTGLPSPDRGLWVADLRLLMPVEKGWFVGRHLQRGFLDQEGDERLRRQLARLVARPAYATSVVNAVLKPLHRLLKDLSERYDGEDPIAEVGLALGRSRMEPSNVEVVFLLDGEVDNELRELLLEWGRATSDAAPDGLEILLPRFEQLSDFPAGDYRSLDLLDAAAFSPVEVDLPTG